MAEVRNPFIFHREGSIPRDLYQKLLTGTAALCNLPFRVRKRRVVVSGKGVWGGSKATAVTSARKHTRDTKTRRGLNRNYDFSRGVGTIFNFGG